MRARKGHVRAIPGVAGFPRRLGVVLGDWATITGFLRKDRGRLPPLVIAFSWLDPSVWRFIPACPHCRRPHNLPVPGSRWLPAVFLLCRECSGAFPGHPRPYRIDISRSGSCCPGMIETWATSVSTICFTLGKFRFLMCRWAGWWADAPGGAAACSVGRGAFSANFAPAEPGNRGGVVCSGSGGVHHERSVHCCAGHTHREIWRVFLPALGISSRRAVRDGSDFLLSPFPGAADERRRSFSLRLFTVFCWHC